MLRALRQDTKFFQWPKKQGPYRIALVNGFVGNTWRIQMIKTAKAYRRAARRSSRRSRSSRSSRPAPTSPAQLGAIENFINQGYDAIVTIAVSPTAFDPVIKRANKAGVVLVPFDNVLDTDDSHDGQRGPARDGPHHRASWLVEERRQDGGKILEVRGLPGNSVDRDRHLGFREVMEAAGNKFEIVEVVGNWDDGTAQKVTADAIAVHGKFDGMFVQGGSTGAVRALMDAKHPFVPVAGEAENGFRKLCAEHADDGLLVLVRRPVAGPRRDRDEGRDRGAAGQGACRRSISVPIPLAEHPDFKAGENFCPGPDGQLLHPE